MKNIWLNGIVLGACAILAACSTESREKWGLKNSAPDEFMVSPRAPLTLPPEYDLLPVNQERYYENDNNDEHADLSTGEKALLSKVDKAGKKTPSSK